MPQSVEKRIARRVVGVLAVCHSMGMDRDLSRLAWGLPMIAGVAVWLSTLGHGFAFDDPLAIVANPLIDGSRPWWDAFTHDFWGERAGFEHIASWRPLTVWSLRVDQLVGGGEPWAFHLTNGLLHLLVLVAVGALGVALDLRPALRMGLGLVVATTPAFAEAVASIVGRGDLLAALFGLCGILAIRPRPRLALLALLLALLAKETAVVYAVTAGLWALRAGFRRRFAAIGALGVAWYAARSAVVGQLGGHVPAIDNPLAAMALDERVFAGFGIIGRYVTWWVGLQPVPADVSAGVTHGGGLAALGLLTIAGLLALAIRAWRRQTPVLLGAVLALTSLVLLSNIGFLLPTPAAGRLAYHPGLGMTLTLMASLSLLPALSRLWPAAVLGGLVYVVSVWSAWTTLASWEDDASLFQSSVAAEPDSARSRCNLARVQIEAGALDDARVHLEAALVRAPDYPLALLNLSVVEERQAPGSEEAWRLATRAAEAERRRGKAQANLCAMGLSRPALSASDVLSACRAAAAAMPGAPEVQTNLARAWARAGDDAAAEAAFAAVVAQHPDHPFVLGHRIGYLASRGRTGEAVTLQRQVFAASPGDASAHRNLVALLLKRAGELSAAGKGTRACEVAREAVTMTPGAASVAQRASQLCGAAR
jgi:tetratricopeptide (TPR) repeat protein